MTIADFENVNSKCSLVSDNKSALMVSMYEKFRMSGEKPARCILANYTAAEEHDLTSDTTEILYTKSLEKYINHT